MKINWHAPVIQWTWLVLLLLTPLVLWILPADFFDHGEVILCPSRAFFDFECLGCGMTRAVMHLHHWQIADAVYFNMGSLLVYPGLIITWGTWTFQAAKQLGLIDRLQASRKS